MTPYQYERQLKITLPLGRAAFLWGARQTGKSTLLRKQFPRSVVYDLLDSDVMIRFLSRPRLLGDELQSFDSADLTQPVIIDKVQKVPNLLNEVHRLIESYGYSFILCVQCTETESERCQSFRRAGLEIRALSSIVE